MSTQAVPNTRITQADAMSQPVEHQTPRRAVLDADQQLRCSRFDQMAKAASAGLMAHPHVESAMVEISGDDADLVFHLNCTIKAEADPSDLMETISQGVISNIERMLGTEFASRRLHFNRSLDGAA